MDRYYPDSPEASKPSDFAVDEETWLEALKEEEFYETMCKTLCQQVRKK